LRRWLGPVQRIRRRKKPDERLDMIEKVVIIVEKIIKIDFPINHFILRSQPDNRLAAPPVIGSGYFARVMDEQRVPDKIW
jgi:hypothetical protein